MTVTNTELKSRTDYYYMTIPGEGGGTRRTTSLSRCKVKITHSGPTFTAQARSNRVGIPVSD